MVWKWIKDNIIGDLAEERRKYEAERREKAEEISKHEAKESAKSEAWKELKTRVFSTRDFDLEIVGESNYQDALRQAQGEVKDYGGKAYITAIILREPENRFDSGAVKVMNGRLETIGYLSRETAAKYGQAFELWEAEGYSLRCQAVLVGGTGRRKSIGAWLDLATPAEAIELTFHDARTRK